MHVLAGNPRMTNSEDMGNFYSAGYDPAFYCHHSNVDCMWKIWKDLSPVNKDPIQQDWSYASYVFYDENRRLVRVYNRDCIDINTMSNAAQSVGVVKKVEETEFPVKLDQTVKILVKRPAGKRSEGEKKKAKDMLFLSGIKFNSEQSFKIVVLVDDVDDGIETTAASSEFAELLEDIEAEEDEYALVTLVEKAGADGATISGIKIELVPIG
ncbi:hypothetical protein L1987_55502 [Smallanthus sonchifolius]|uniref:Uncharacterized protein n=1 Tax=Smallanthus sonchifolius TaxID=185202 RepID=A0ACB9EB60_9ASTR|nr:hypothetical protein L1987_55502 [Smallanthus sonchifolius]